MQPGNQPLETDISFSGTTVHDSKAEHRLAPEAISYEVNQLPDHHQPDQETTVSRGCSPDAVDRDERMNVSQKLDNTELTSTSERPAPGPTGLHSKNYLSDGLSEVNQINVNNLVFDSSDLPPQLPRVPQLHRGRKRTCP